MKTILLILLLASATTINSDAQGTRNCKCGKRAIQHTVVSAQPGKTTPVKSPETAPAVPAPCFVYRKDNIMVTECPGIFYSNDNKGVFEYGTDGEYLGYFPINTDPGKCGVPVEIQQDVQVAPQHTTIDHYRGVAPAGGNYCTKCTPQ